MSIQTSLSHTSARFCDWLCSPLYCLLAAIGELQFTCTPNSLPWSIFILVPALMAEMFLKFLDNYQVITDNVTIPLHNAQ